MPRTFKLTQMALGLSFATICCVCSLLVLRVHAVEKQVGTGNPQLIIHTQSMKSLTLDLELAMIPSEWERGLMFRQHLAETAGMLFIFPKEELRSFWMKNTLIPLDMLFIDKDYRIVGIVHKAQPQTLNPRTVNLPSRYVLEVNGGYCERFGVKSGDIVTFQGVKGH